MALGGQKKVGDYRPCPGMRKVWRKRESPKASKRDNVLEPTEARGNKRQQSQPGGDVGSWCYFP